MNNTVTGGHIAFDHRGGPNGGEEIAFYPKSNGGLFGVSAKDVSGGSADFKFNVTSNGKPLFVYSQELTKSKQIERKIAPGQEIVGLVPVPNDEFFNNLLPDDPGPTQSAAAKSSKVRAQTAKRSTPAAIPAEIKAKR